MAKCYEIHQKVGVARLGNSPTEFYLAPESVGGLPIACDLSGNESGSFVHQFKDSLGRIKRQAAKFRIFEKDGNDETSESDEEGSGSLQERTCPLVETAITSDEPPATSTMSTSKGL